MTDIIAPSVAIELARDLVNEIGIERARARADFYASLARGAGNDVYATHYANTACELYHAVDMQERQLVLTLDTEAAA